MEELASCYQEVEQFDAAEKIFEELRRVSPE
jgi:hypothetical protein